MTKAIRPISAPDAADFLRLFFGDAKIKRYVYGINEYAENVARIVDIDGFIDDYTQSTQCLGRPVCKLGSVDPQNLVLSCVTVARPLSALRKLEDAGIRRYLDYFSAAEASDGRLPQVDAIVETRADYRKHVKDYDWVRERLGDNLSRDAFDRLLEFRLTGSLLPMTAFEYAADRQYFEPFLDLGAAEVFVDGGGFDGYTSAEFARRNPLYSGIHLFEPSAKMLAVAQGRLADLPRVTFHQLGLYDRQASLSFDSDSGSASKIAENGAETISVARLDDAVGEAVSFIKLDLEGAELAALRGARNHIVSDHPKLAVAVYHRPSDFWEIPRLVLGYREDYEIYLRHYTEGWTETVMFFIPRNT